METDYTPLKREGRNPYAVAAGSALLYGLLNFFSNTFLLPSAPVIALRPQVVLPMFVGLIYGPSPGFVVGMCGNLIGDTLFGYGVIQFWHWHIANGLLGMFPGFLKRSRLIPVSSIRGFVLIEFTVIIASALAVGFAVAMDILFVHQMRFPASLHAWILPAFITDAVNGFVLLPILLIFRKHMVITVETRTIMIITALLVFTVLITSLSLTWSVWRELDSREAMIRVFYCAGIIAVLTIILGLFASVFLARRITEPMIRLTKAADSVEKGVYDLGILKDMLKRADEFGLLSKIFQNMAQSIQLREDKLKKRLQALQIKIDKAKQAEEVAEIVETEYFQQLREKARSFRKAQK